MIGHVYQTEAEAIKAIAIIDAARGPTETLRDPGGRGRIATTKTWAFPVPLRDGSWCVPWKDRLDGIEGKVVIVEARQEAVPLKRESLDVSDLRSLSATPPKGEVIKR